MFGAGSSHAGGGMSFHSALTTGPCFGGGVENVGAGGRGEVAFRSGRLAETGTTFRSRCVRCESDRGADRSEAIARMKRAISEYRIAGVQTTLDFADYVMDHDAFISGDFDTHFVEKYFAPEVLQGDDAAVESIGAMALASLLQEQKGHQKIQKNGTTSRWKANRT